MADVWTEEEFLAFLEETFGDDAGQIAQDVRSWLDRGDGVAAYRNEDVSSPEAGHCKLVSYGTEQAVLPGGLPPETLPDIRDPDTGLVSINSGYQLHGMFRAPLTIWPALAGR